MPVPDVAVPSEPLAESPTGKPVLPPALVPWVAGIVGVAAAVARALPDHTVGDAVCQELVMWGTLLLALGPGMRHRPTQ